MCCSAGVTPAMSSQGFIFDAGCYRGFDLAIITDECEDVWLLNRYTEFLSYVVSDVFWFSLSLDLKLTLLLVGISAGWGPVNNNCELQLTVQVPHSGDYRCREIFHTKQLSFCEVDIKVIFSQFMLIQVTNNYHTFLALEPFHVCVCKIRYDIQI